MRIGIGERLKYRDIEWLMPSVDVASVLEKLNINVAGIAGSQITAFCPDHHLFMGRRQSHPKWTVNVKTGETFCFTEGRGSNLVWTVSRILDCHPRETVKFLTGIEAEISVETLNIARRNHSRRRITPSLYRDGLQEDEPKVPQGLSSIKRDMDDRYVSQRTYDFFMHPPGKALPTNIKRETVDRCRVFERTWGRYANRAIIPFLMRGELVGFCAVDVFGKKEWLKAHPSESESDYRKTLYPSDFVRSQCLYGYDDCQKGAEVLAITEGAREVMKLHQEGFTNSVAILGSHLSDGQYMLLTELRPERIALMFDGDSVGRMITDRLAEKLSRNWNGRTLKCYVPLGKDPKNLAHDDFQALIRKRL